MTALGRQLHGGVHPLPSKSLTLMPYQSLMGGCSPAKPRAGGAQCGSDGTACQGPGGSVLSPAVPRTTVRKQDGLMRRMEKETEGLKFQCNLV